MIPSSSGIGHLWVGQGMSTNQCYHRPELGSQCLVTSTGRFVVQPINARPYLKEATETATEVGLFRDADEQTIQSGRCMGE